MKAILNVKQTVDLTAAIRRAVLALTERDVYIGIPAEKTEPRKNGEPVSNAELSYIHEFGAPAAGIPPRPHLLPGVNDVRPEAVELLRGAAKKALKGNSEAVDRALKKIGLLGQKAVQARFVNNDWPPLDPEYAHYKALKKDDTGEVMKDKKGRILREKSRWEKATKGGKEGSEANPLIDTAQLRKAHTYVVRKRGGGMITPEGAS